MARRSAPATPGRRRGRGLRLALLPAVLVVAFAALAPAPAGAQEADAAPTLTDVLEGSVAGLEATAVVGSLDSTGLELEVVNDGDEPVEIAIPFGTLVATDVEGDQTLAVTPPETSAVAAVAASGGTPTITVEPGESSHDLGVYCAEQGDGFPYEATEVEPLAPAHEVLAAALRQASAQGADHSTAQDAVWWLTDSPVLPVRSELSPLLADVDTAAFAAEPFRVVPDTGYDPIWMTGDLADPAPESPIDDEQAAGIIDETFDGGTGSGSSSGGTGFGMLLWVVLVGVVAVATVVIATRAGGGRPRPQVAHAAMPAGWYADPWMPTGHRYWDGRTWTQRTLP